MKGVFFFFGQCCMTYGTLAPQPGVKPGPWQWKCWATGLPGGSWSFLFFFFNMFYSSKDCFGNSSQPLVEAMFCSYADLWSPRCQVSFSPAFHFYVFPMMRWDTVFLNMIYFLPHLFGMLVKKVMFSGKKRTLLAIRKLSRFCFQLCPHLFAISWKSPHLSDLHFPHL